MTSWMEASSTVYTFSYCSRSSTFVKISSSKSSIAFPFLRWTCFSSLMNPRCSYCSGSSLCNRLLFTLLAISLLRCLLVYTIMCFLYNSNDLAWIYYLTFLFHKITVLYYVMIKFTTDIKLNCWLLFKSSKTLFKHIYF